MYDQCFYFLSYCVLIGPFLRGSILPGKTRGMELYPGALCHFCWKHDGPLHPRGVYHLPLSGPAPLIGDVPVVPQGGNLCRRASEVARRNDQLMTKES